MKLSLCQPVAAACSRVCHAHGRHIGVEANKTIAGETYSAFRGDEQEEPNMKTSEGRNSMEARETRGGKVNLIKLKKSNNVIGKMQRKSGHYQMKVIRRASN